MPLLIIHLLENIETIGHKIHLMCLNIPACSTADTTCLHYKTWIIALRQVSHLAFVVGKIETQIQRRTLCF
ncbi:hypothetical protein D3C73_674930 [compost metagenome]